MEPNPEKKFRLGLCMAGAVSAGAYTAGVLDYLFETLELWEVAKENNRKAGADADPEIPMYDVVIEVMNGTSGGGMCAVIGACELLHDPKIRYGSQGSGNRLYDAWVNLNDKQDAKTIGQMLETDDITEKEKDDQLCKEFGKQKGVRSLFNSRFIDMICNRVLEVNTAAEVQRPYISKELDVAVTTTNLRGIRYGISFQTQDGKKVHHMDSFRHFMRFKRNITAPLKSCLPLAFHPGLKNTIRSYAEYIRLATMGTGAFPIGLEPRKVITQASAVKNALTFPVLREKDSGSDTVCFTQGKDQVVVIAPEFPANCIGEEYAYLAVDGGAMNNEPFDLTRDLLLERYAGRMVNPRDPGKVDNAIIMIDPFPNDGDSYPCDSDPKPEKRYGYSKKIPQVAMQILGALRNQPLFRPKDLYLAMHEETYNRYMIVPTGHKGEEPVKPIAIASAALSGFGGFLDRKFREHDYTQGRRNCQQFLRKHFALPAEVDNPIVSYSEAQKDRFRFEDEGKLYVPIIPDLRRPKGVDENNDPSVIREPKFPEYNYETFEELKYGLSGRIDAIVNEFAKEALQPGSGIWNTIKGWLLSAGIWALGVKRRIKALVYKMIESELRENELLNGR